MINREKRCSECLQLQKEEMEYPYVCGECEVKVLHDLYDKYVDMAHRNQTLLEESVASGNWKSALIYDIEKNVYNNVILDIEEILKRVL